jgi:hypothetical protein
MKRGRNKIKKCKRLTEEQKNMIFKIVEEKTELRKIARIVELRIVQYHILLYFTFINRKKKIRAYIDSS